MASSDRTLVSRNKPRQAPLTAAWRLEASRPHEKERRGARLRLGYRRTTPFEQIVTQIKMLQGGAFVVSFSASSVSRQYRRYTTAGTSPGSLQCIVARILRDWQPKILYRNEAQHPKGLSYRCEVAPSQHFCFCCCCCSISINILFIASRGVPVNYIYFFQGVSLFFLSELDSFCEWL